MKKMKYIIERELYLKIGSLLDNYHSLLDRLGEEFRNPTLEQDWNALSTVFEEYDTLPTYEDENTSNEEKRELMVGDSVRVVDSGECYTTYSEWVEKHIVDPSAKYLWDYEQSCDNGDKGKILCIAPHEYGTAQLAYVQMTDRLCYLIGVKGLEKI